MSMYLVSNAHIRELAVFFETHRYGHRHGQQQVEDANQIAKQLASGNLQSAEARYGEDHGLGDFEGLEVTLSDLTYPQVQRPIDILKMLACYEYQSCEPEDFYSSTTYQLIIKMRDVAINLLPDYEEAIRDYTEEVPPEQRNVVCLSDLCG